MQSLNKVQIIGRLGRAPEIRSMNNGERIATLAIATSESWKDKNTGERKEKTEWINTVVFNENLVSLAEKFLDKGSNVYVEGQLQTRQWTDAQGATRYSTEVVVSRFKGEIILLDPPPKQEQRQAAPQRQERQQPVRQQSNAGYATKAEGRYDDLDEAIPF